jgi:hypothetical protein
LHGWLTLFNLTDDSDVTFSLDQQATLTHVKLPRAG